MLPGESDDSRTIHLPELPRPVRLASSKGVPPFKVTPPPLSRNFRERRAAPPPGWHIQQAYSLTRAPNHPTHQRPDHLPKKKPGCAHTYAARPVAITNND